MRDSALGRAPAVDPDPAAPHQRFGPLESSPLRRRDLERKRAGKDRTGLWQLVSDNPNKRAWPTLPWPADAPVIGEVKWAARTLV